MTGLEAQLDGIIEYLENELQALEDTDPVTGTSVQLFKEVGRGRLDKVMKYPAAYIWLNRGRVEETHIVKTTHGLKFIVRVWTEVDSNPRELMDELIRLIGKVYDLYLGTQSKRGMEDLVQRRSVTDYVLFPAGMQGILANAADLYIHVETRFRVT